MVLSRGLGVYLWDESGKRYIDMISAYSAVSFGHSHPKLLAALTQQAAKLAVTSRAFYTDQLGAFSKALIDTTGLEGYKVLPMNSGAEAVETAVKAVRKWRHKVKGIVAGNAEIIVCDGNFAGRTTTIVSFPSEAQYRDGFGPLRRASSRCRLLMPVHWKTRSPTIRPHLSSNQFKAHRARAGFAA